MATTDSATSTVERFVLRVQTCPFGGGTRCRAGVDTTCVAGIHLRPPALGATYEVWSTPSGRVVHSSSTCPALRGRTVQRHHVTWAHLRTNGCSSCRATPDAVTAAAAEARRVSSALGTIADATRHWPGRVPQSAVDDVQAAVTRLGMVKVHQFADLKALALQVAEILCASTGPAWTPPPCPEKFVWAAAVDLVGVDDDPFFRSGARPRTGADREAAEASSGKDLDAFWRSWYDTVLRTGGPDPRSRLSVHAARPAHQQAIARLVDAWQAEAQTLIDTEARLRVVALPVGGLSANDRTLPGRAVLELASIAAASVRAPKTACLVVVPHLVARWLARQPLSLFEDIGDWPGDQTGVRALELLVQLADGDVYRMAELLPVAADLAAAD